MITTFHSLLAVALSRENRQPLILRIVGSKIVLATPVLVRTTKCIRSTTTLASPTRALGVLPSTCEAVTGPILLKWLHSRADVLPYLDKIIISQGHPAQRDKELFLCFQRHAQGLRVEYPAGRVSCDQPCHYPLQDLCTRGTRLHRPLAFRKGKVLEPLAAGPEHPHPCVAWRLRGPAGRGKKNRQPRPSGGSPEKDCGVRAARARCDVPLRCVQPQVDLLTTHRRDPRYQLARGAHHF